jgi:hypothetical protein
MREQPEGSFQRAPHAVDQAQRTAAKVFGVAYLPTFAIVVGVNFGVLQPLIGGMAPEQAARNILANAQAYRVGALGFVLYVVGVQVLSAALYVILKPVDPILAALATLGRWVHGLTWLLVALNLFTALRLLSRPEFAALPPGHLPVLARLYLSGFDPYYVGLLFWSLGATIGAYLLHKSGYVPRAFAVFGIAASAWCAACTIALLVFPGFSNVVNLWLFDSPMALFEIGLSLVLLFRGLRAEGVTAARS